MAGLNLLDMLTGPTGRRAVAQMGQQFGLDETQSSQAVAALLPALSSGLKRNVGQPGGLEALVGALSKGQHTQYLDQPETLAKPETVDDGNAILGHLLGSKDISRAAAARASERTGISDGVLKQMLPLVASMAMGALSKQKDDPNTSNMLTAAMAAVSGQSSTSSGGGLLGTVMGMLGGGSKTAAGAAPASGGGMAGLLGNFLDADKDGSAMDDIFEMITKR
ncbi:MAG: DUF937 domain-containing protein [Pseudomonadota bacterium]